MGKSRRLLPVALGALVVVGALGTVRVVRSRRPVFFDFPWGGQSPAVALSADGRWLAVVSGDRGISIWPVEPGAARREVPADGKFFIKVAFDPDGTLVALDLSSERSFFRRYRIDAADVREEAAFVTSRVSSKFSPVGSVAVAETWSPNAGTPHPGWAYDLEIVSLRTGDSGRLIEHLKNLGTFGWSPSGALVWDRVAAPIYSSQKATLEVWHASDGRLLVQADEAECPAAVLDPGDRCVVPLAVPQRYEVREIATGRVVRTFVPPADAFDSGADPPPAPSLSADGELIAMGTRTVEVRSIRTGELVASFAPPPGAQGEPAIAFDADGGRVAAAWEGKVAVWTLPR